MYKLNHVGVIVLSGCLWSAIGLFLMPLGLYFLGESLSLPTVDIEGSYPLVSSLSDIFGSHDSAAVAIIALGLFLGSMKAKYVLNKTVKKGVSRILSLPAPISITQIYGVKYLLLVAVMIGLGISLRAFGVPKDIRGFIDVAVGAALITGGTSYFREAANVYRSA